MALGCRFRPAEEAVTSKARNLPPSLLMLPLGPNFGFDAPRMEGRPRFSLRFVAPTASEDVARFFGVCFPAPARDGGVRSALRCATLATSFALGNLRLVSELDETSASAHQTIIADEGRETDP